VGFIKDEDLVPVTGGSESRALSEFPSVIDAIVARRVNLDDIERTGAIPRQFDTTVTFSARCIRRSFGTVEATSEYSSGRRLATTTGTREQVGVIDAILSKCGTQRISHLRLPDEFIERFGSVPTIESDCHPLRLPAPADFLGAARAPRSE
jgi:hypothetical protein